MAYGVSTSNKLDAPLKRLSVVSQYLGDNGYKFTGLHSIRVLTFATEATVTYNETLAADSFGTPTLAAPTDNEFTLAYNQALARRIQRTQIQDVPVDGLAAEWAAQQISEAFIPAHDAYSLGKLKAARPLANAIAVGSNLASPTVALSLAFGQAVNKARVAGTSNTNQMVAWLSYDFAAYLSASINFTGSDAGYKDAQAGYLGKHKGVVCVEVPVSYFAGDDVYVIVADKRAVINVTPKVSPEDFRVLKEIPGFDGVEVQIRDRGDTFVLTKRAVNIATVEVSAAS